MSDTTKPTQPAEAQPAAEPWQPDKEAAWVEDCNRWRGKVLTGSFRHWCLDWDLLPVDETCMEWPCECFAEARANVA